MNAMKKPTFVKWALYRFFYLSMPRITYKTQFVDDAEEEILPSSVDLIVLRSKRKEFARHFFFNVSVT